MKANLKELACNIEIDDITGITVLFMKAHWKGLACDINIYDLSDEDNDSIVYS